MSALEHIYRAGRRRPGLAGLVGLSTLACAAFIVLLVLSNRWLDRQREVAEDHRNQAEGARSEAQAALENTRRQLARFHLRRALERQDDSDPTSPLPDFAAAFALEPDKPAQAIHGLRLGQALSRCPTLLRLWHHPGGVRQACFSPEGRLVATAGGDGSARLWRVSDGEPVSPPLWHARGAVTSVAFSPDGRWLLTTGADATARTWRVDSGKPVLRLDHPEPIRRARFSTDGSRVLTVCEDRAARLWSVATGKLSCPPLAHPGELNEACFSPDGKTVATACGDGKARLWQAGTGALLHAIHHPGPLWHLAFDPAGRMLATACQDKALRVWNVATGGPIAVPFRHSKPVLRASFTPDSCWVVGADAAGQLSVWDLYTTRLVAGGPYDRTDDSLILADGTRIEEDSPTVFVHDLATSPDGTLLLVASENGTAEARPLLDNLRGGLPFRHGHAVRSAAFSPDGRSILTGSDDGTARLWASAGPSPPPPHRVLSLPGVFGHGVFSPDGQRVLVAGAAGACIWEPASGAARLLKHPARMRIGAFTPDGRMLATGGEDGAARLWKLDGTLHATLEHHRRPVLDVTFSPTGTLLATASQDGTARLWDVKTGRPVGPPLAHSQGAAHAVTWPGLLVLVTALARGGPDEMVEEGDAPPLPSFLRQRPHPRDLRRRPKKASPGDIENERTVSVREAWPRGTVVSVEFSPDGKLLATACMDGRARLWRADSAALDGEPLEHEGPVYQASFSPDGDRLITAGELEARLWDVSRRSLIARLPHRGTVLHVSFSLDGKRVATASGDGTARLWDGRTGAPLGLPLEHDTPVRRAVFAPSGDFLLTQAGSTARLWDVWHGLPLPVGWPSTGQLACVEFSRDGSRVVLVRQKDRLEVCTVPGREPRDGTALQMLAHVQSATGVSTSGELTPLAAGRLADAWQALARRQFPSLPSAEERASWSRKQMQKLIFYQDWHAVRWHAKRLLAVDPGDRNLWQERARAEFLLGDTAGANLSINRSEDGLPPSSEQLRLRVLLHLHEGRPDQALADLEACLAARPSQPVLQLLAICLHQERGQSERARSARDRLMRWLVDDKEASLRHLEKMSRGDPDIPLVSRLVAAIRERCARVTPGEPTPSWALAALGLLPLVDPLPKPIPQKGKRHVERQDEPPNSLFRALLARDPADHEARRLYIFLSTTDEKPEVTLAECDRLIAARRADRGIWLTRAQLLLAGKQYSHAEADFDRALEAGSRPEAVFRGRFEARAWQGRWRQAEDDLRRLGIDRSPLQHATRAKQLALLRLKLGDRPGYYRLTAGIEESLRHSRNEGAGLVDLCWLLALAPDAVRSWDLMLEDLAREEAAESATAAVLFRAGRFGKALQALERLAPKKDQPQRKVEEDDDALIATVRLNDDRTPMEVRGLFEAMIRHRLGQAKKAREALQKAIQGAAALSKDTAWDDRLMIELLVAEAQTLIGQK